ncbi:hypothetical protein KQI52_09190 [bacterium]|nr:hypothetical protein [bacterium]
MMDTTRFFDALAQLVLYPQPGYRQEVSSLLQIAWREQHPAAKHLTAYAREIDLLDVPELQERFIQAFEHNPKTALEVGWHVYGERYERGSLMVALRQSLAAVDIPENSELPDHLSHVLRLIPRADDELAVRLIEQYVLPTLAKVETALAPAESNNGNGQSSGLTNGVRENSPEAVMDRQAHIAGPVFIPLILVVQAACRELSVTLNSGVDA